MRVSQCMERYLPEISFRTVDERPVDSLGLLVSKCGRPLCSFLDDEKYASDMTDDIAMLFVTEDVLRSRSFEGVGCCVVSSPRNVFFRLHNQLKQDTEYIRREFETKIDETARISGAAVIAEKNVIIGKNVQIEPFVVIYENTVIGDNCIIRAGARIGGAGFEQKRDGDAIFAVEHLGGTVIEHDVEIQNNSCVDRAVYPWDDTVVGAYTRIDNLVHIGHAAKIGRCCMIVAQSGIGGRTVIGKDVWIGFGATLRNGIAIHDGARINMGSVVTRNVAEGESVTGNFAIEHKKFIENLKSSL